MKSNKKLLQQLSFNYCKTSKLYEEGDLGKQFFELFNTGSVLERVSCQPGFMLGRTNDGYGIALVWDDDNEEDAGVLSMETHAAILKAAQSMGITKRPLNIHGTVNAGPNGSQSYVFKQMAYIAE